jgi:putative YphP/YqiW family bacilliredoxin
MFYQNYMHDMTQPMRRELTEIGIEELLTPEAVEEALPNAQGTALVVVNSVCGCAGGIARPAISAALQNSKVPVHLYSVFAGQEREATAKAREYFAPNPPSSPSVALMKDGELVYFLPREDIEGRDADEVTTELTRAFDRFC